MLPITKLLMSMQLIPVWVPVRLLDSGRLPVLLLTNCWAPWIVSSLTNGFSLLVYLLTCLSLQFFPNLSPPPLVSSHCLLAAALAVPAMSQFQLLWGIRNWAAPQWLQRPLSSSCCQCTSARHWQGETHSSTITVTPLSRRSGSITRPQLRHTELQTGLCIASTSSEKCWRRLQTPRHVHRFLQFSFSSTFVSISFILCCFDTYWFIIICCSFVWFQFCGLFCFYFTLFIFSIIYPDLCLLHFLGFLFPSLLPPHTHPVVQRLWPLQSGQFPLLAYQRGEFGVRVRHCLSLLPSFLLILHHLLLLVPHSFMVTSGLSLAAWPTSQRHGGIPHGAFITGPQLEGWFIISVRMFDLFPSSFVRHATRAHFVHCCLHLNLQLKITDNYC